MINEIEAAKTEMQEKLDHVVAPGAVVVVDLGGAGGASDFVRIPVDRFEMLFARPVFGADGATAGHYFWAVCFEVGFDMGGPQHVRIFKMENVTEERPDLFLFRDQRGYDCFIESVDVIDDERRADFKRWREYKARNKEAFERLYGEFTAESLEMALNMEAAGE
jgi:hypothetical protein